MKKKQAAAPPCEKCEWADKQQKGKAMCLWVTGCVKETEGDGQRAVQ